MWVNCTKQSHHTKTKTSKTPSNQHLFPPPPPPQSHPHHTNTTSPHITPTPHPPTSHQHHIHPPTHTPHPPSVHRQMVMECLLSRPTANRSLPLQLKSREHVPTPWAPWRMDSVCLLCVSHTWIGADFPN